MRLPNQNEIWYDRRPTDFVAASIWALESNVHDSITCHSTLWFYLYFSIIILLFISVNNPGNSYRQEMHLFMVHQNATPASQFWTKMRKKKRCTEIFNNNPSWNHNFYLKNIQKLKYFPGLLNMHNKCTWH